MRQISCQGFTALGLTWQLWGVVGSTRIAGILVEVVIDEKVLRIPLKKQERESGKKPYERHSSKTGWKLRLTVEGVFE